MCSRSAGGCNVSSIVFVVSVGLSGRYSGNGTRPGAGRPQHNKVEVDNDQVRVLRFHLGPKESTPMHEHPAMVLVALTNGHTKVTSGDGTARESTRKAGELIYRPALKHAVENLTNEEYEMIEVELKAPPAAGKR